MPLGTHTFTYNHHNHHKLHFVRLPCKITRNKREIRRNSSQINARRASPQDLRPNIFRTASICTTVKGRRTRTHGRESHAHTSTYSNIRGGCISTLSGCGPAFGGRGLLLFLNKTCCNGIYYTFSAAQTRSGALGSSSAWLLFLRPCGPDNCA